MNGALAFLIFSGVIAAGNAISCITCKTHEKGANNCDGEPEECPNADDQCATRMEYTIIGDDKITTVSKGCLSASNKNYCKDELRKLNTTTMLFYVYSKCCEDKDCCNSDPIEMPKDNKTENGHSCDSCFEPDSTVCKGTKPQQCEGNQIKCLDFSGSVKRPGNDLRNFTFKGCVTPDFCKLDLNFLPGCEVGKNAMYKCS